MKYDLSKIIEEFKERYLNTEQGKKHLEAYKREQEEVKQIFNEILEKRERGENTTDLVINKLLPIKRKSVTPAGVKTLSAYGIKEEEYPKVAREVLNLILGLLDNVDNVDKQKEIVNNFAKSPYIRGLQAGIISPVLHSLRPRDYLIINSKVVNTVRFISREIFRSEMILSTRIEDYPENNVKLKKFIKRLSEYADEFQDYDVFDAFCHWMCDKNLGGYARFVVTVPTDENEAINLAQTTDDPKVLEELYNKHKEKPRVVKVIVDNPYCPVHIKRDYLSYVLNDYLKMYERRLLDEITDWGDLLEAMKICLEVWNPPRETSPLPEIDLDNPKIQEILEEIQNHKQVILYGPPGTSKTYFAKGLAYAIAGKEENVVFVQFHPSYTYEDFVECISPEIDKKTGQIIFKVKDKIFKELCKKADKNPNQNFVLVIDEINRADLSKVFGEIFSALEYRKEKIRLLYSRESFTIPANLYIIGTMNTLDKSTIDIDFALMRRFRFIEIKPDSNILRKMLEENRVKPELIEKIVKAFEKIQEFFPLGHAYFKNVKSKQDLRYLWDHQLSFLLKEYFTDLRKDIYEKVKQIYWEELELEKD